MSAHPLMLHFLSLALSSLSFFFYSYTYLDITLHVITVNTIVDFCHDNQHIIVMTTNLLKMFALSHSN